MTPRYSIGIDLGTTNSVVGYVDLNDESRAVRLLDLPQISTPGSVKAFPLLPSFLYLATDDEAASGSIDLPWANHMTYAVGGWARTRSMEAPDRTVAAAKSWLCHGRVNRRDPILPWNAPDSVPKVSPVEASRRYLAHIVSAWNAAFPNAPLNGQQVALTVPASFDAVARELTREAALGAGLPEQLILLEEPQAALYAWLAARGAQWRRDLREGDRILVCDVGGGTTDLTLIRVESEAGQLELRRVRVGNHILVGGDNMDIAIAHSAREAFADKAVVLDPWQAVGLWHACRQAKETLLGEKAPQTCPVTVLGRGRRVIGGTIRVDLHRKEVERLLVDGFFPECRRNDEPVRPPASGFRELGLPYESDAAITRHLAQFLSISEKAGAEEPPPTHVLLNGGVFKAQALTQRLLAVVQSWYGPKQAPRMLVTAPELDYAVARGAAYYGAAKLGKGIRIRGGAPRSYYVGIETAMPAVPGAPPPIKALCVLPQGQEEGTETDVPGDPIGLVVGEPARFRFFSSNARGADAPGAVLNAWRSDELTETAPMETELKAKDHAGDLIPVRFHVRLTELGVFELWCVGQDAGQKWKLEFNIREG